MQRSIKSVSVVILLTFLLIVTGCAGVSKNHAPEPSAQDQITEQTSDQSEDIDELLSESDIDSDNPDSSRQVEYGPPEAETEEIVEDELPAAETEGTVDDGLTTPETEETVEDELPDVNGSYTSRDDVALYLHVYDHLPDNFITKKEAQSLGWTGGSLEPYAPGKCIGGDYFGNYEGLLPESSGREYHECDIDTLGAKSRGAKRIVYSNDGLIFYTQDHYASYEQLY